MTITTDTLGGEPAATPPTPLLPWHDLGVILEEVEEGTKLVPLPEGDTPDAAAMDAMASQLLRAHRAITSEIQRYTEAEALEADRLKLRYNGLRAPLQKRLEVLTTALDTLARNVRFPGKSRSRKVGSGTYGLRTVPGKFTLAGPEEALGWAKEHLPEAVRGEFKLALPDIPEELLERGTYSLLPSALYEHLEKAEAKMVENQLVTKDGEVVPGVEFTAAADKVVIKYE